jgi:hypothetical protein
MNQHSILDAGGAEVEKKRQRSRGFAGGTALQVRKTGELRAEMIGVYA